MIKSLFAAAVMCMVFCLCSCSSVADNQFDREWENKDSAVKVNVRMARDDYAFNQPIFVATTLVNKSGSPVTVEKRQRFRDLKYILSNTSRDGEAVTYSSHARKILDNPDSAYKLEKETVPSGESCSWELNLREYFQMKSFTHYSLAVEGVYLNKNGERIPFRVDGLNFKIR